METNRAISNLYEGIINFRPN